MSSALRPLEMLRYRQHPQHQKKKNPPTAASSHYIKFQGHWITVKHPEGIEHIPNGV